MSLEASEIDAHVGKRMRRRREYLGISQARLAHHLGLTFSQVQKYEKGANRVGAGRLYLVAEALEVPVHYFFEDLPALSGSAGGASTPAAASHDDDDGDPASIELAMRAIGSRATRESIRALVLSLAATQEQAVQPKKRAS